MKCIQCENKQTCEKGKITLGWDNKMAQHHISLATLGFLKIQKISRKKQRPFTIQAINLKTGKLYVKF